jgi:hypothetical protein
MARMGTPKARSLFTWTGVAQQLIATVEQRRAPRSCSRTPNGMSRGMTRIELAISAYLCLP